MTEVIDYAWWRPPSMSWIGANGFSQVARYLSHDTTGKSLTATEADSIRRAGYGLVLVFEDCASPTENSYYTGNAYTEGQQEARMAAGFRKQVGEPDSAPVAFAFDREWFNGSPGFVRDFMTGARSVIGSTARAYGSAATCDAAGPGPHWQTSGWSAGRVSANAGLYQYRYAGNWDASKILKPWNGSSGMTQAEFDAFKNLVVYNALDGQNVRMGDWFGKVINYARSAATRECACTCSCSAGGLTPDQAADLKVVADFVRKVRA